MACISGDPAGRVGPHRARRDRSGRWLRPQAAQLVPGHAPRAHGSRQGMSPARARTSRPDIVAVGRELLEAGGLDAVTMQAIADRVGIRAPSLYKRFSDRGDLISAIGASVLADLGEELVPFIDLEPAAGVRAVAEAFRRFALDHPRSYELIFMSLPPGS